MTDAERSAVVAALKGVVESLRGLIAVLEMPAPPMPDPDPAPEPPDGT